MQHDRLFIPTSANNINPDSALPAFMGPDAETFNQPNSASITNGLQPKIEGPFIVPPEKLAKFGSENDYPNTPEFPFVGNGQCPLLPQSLAPNLGLVEWLIQGPVLYKNSEADRNTPPNGYGYERYSEIARGTVIFTPNAKGRYTGAKHGNHVAVFLRYGVYRGQNGIFVIDQYQGDRPDLKP